MWETFSLLEEESEVLEIENQVVEGLLSRGGQSFLIGKQLADHYVSKEIIKKTLLQGWRPSGSITFKVLGANLFIIDFEHACDKFRVLEGRPWVFDGSLFSVKEFDGLTPPASFKY